MIADMYNQNKEKIGEVELKETVFDVPENKSIVHQYVRWLLARKRQGSANTKTRGEVSGGGKKPWRQKGTGRARAGSNRSPIWRKGGIVFGPRPRDFAFDLPKKLRKKALKITLSARLREDRISFVDKINLEKISTKEAFKIVKNFGEKSILFIVEDKNDVIYKSFRNIPKVNVLRWNEINAYEILKSRNLVVTKESLDKIQEVWG